MRVNGLYGHVRSNDVRSVVLFTAFVAAFHLLAMLALLVPLAMLDPDHAPLYGWTGYLTRWVPIVTVVGALLFALQMVWHVRTVRSKTEFRFVDSSDEPRLCRIVEPLAIAVGLPPPYVGVIESPALNAFACGIRRKDAVLVFTRGLIDGLDDDELAAVAAHEIIHVVNGDIRLIAATNVCLDTLRLVQQRPDARRVNRISEACTLPILALGMPLMAVLVLVVLFLRRLAVDGSHLARLLIASAREFIADAEAVRLTHNPAGLVSALRRIEGRSTIPGLAAGQDAMMIDGAHEGAFATHPTIADRIAAVVALTGAMALIAPSRRDTRDPELRGSGGFGPWSTPFSQAAAKRSPLRGGALARVSGAGGVNRLGLTREMSVGAVAALGVFVWIQGPDLARPSALAKAFDPAPVRAFFAMGGAGIKCQMEGLGWLIRLADKPTGCDENSIEEMLAAHRGKGGLLDLLAGPQANRANNARYPRSDGTFTNVPAPAAQLAEVQNARCFQTERYKVGDRGLHSVTKPTREGDTISLPRYLALNDAAALRVAEASAVERDAAILDYFKTRKRLGAVIHRFFGDPGLQVATLRFTGPEHETAITLLRERLTDPGFASVLIAVERAELELLAAAPRDFVPCTARRRQAHT